MEVNDWIYHKVSYIRCTKSQHLKDSGTVLRLSLPNPLKPDVKSKMKSIGVDHSDVVGAAPTTSEWSTILLPTKVQLILEVLW